MRELHFNKNGNMVFAGVDVVELAKTYGTPLYVIDENYVRERCREIKKNFTGKYENTKAAYASKALQTKEICKIVTEEGMSLDTVSAGEIFTAIKAGVDPDKILFHGNNKTPDEIEFALKNKIGRLIVDNEHELDLIMETAQKLNQKVKIQLRITPGVDSHTHKYISTGSIDSKFGIPYEKEERNKIINKALSSEHIELMGLHFHVGSQLMENDSHVMALKIILNILKEIYDEMGFVTKELNLGGGFGVRYVDGEETTKIRNFTDPMMEMINVFFKENNFNLPTVYIEPGRWIVGNAGITLYTVGSIKEIKGIKTYIAVDGGMADNPRTILYQAEYEAVIANRKDRSKEKSFSIVGKCCESGDVLINETKLAADVESGDVLCIFTTGAYNYSMSSNYNRLPRPAMVIIKDGEARLSVRRETYEDLISREI